jgi:hypothetical protein
MFRNSNVRGVWKNVHGFQNGSSWSIKNLRWFKKIMIMYKAVQNNVHGVRNKFTQVQEIYFHGILKYVCDSKNMFSGF